eukprot:1876970-Prymnesium_polylepis.2
MLSRTVTWRIRVRHATHTRPSRAWSRHPSVACRAASIAHRPAAPRSRAPRAARHPSTRRRRPHTALRAPPRWQWRPCTRAARRLRLDGRAKARRCPVRATCSHRATANRAAGWRRAQTAATLTRRRAPRVRTRGGKEARSGRRRRRPPRAERGGARGHRRGCRSAGVMGSSSRSRPRQATAAATGTPPTPTRSTPHGSRRAGAPPPGFRTRGRTAGRPAR